MGETRSRSFYVLAAIFALFVLFLALEEGPEAAAKIHAEILRAIEEDRAEAIILGCAGMADLAASLSHSTGVPVIDGVGVAVKLVEALVGLGLQTSKVSGYAAPHPKPYAGDLAHHGLAPSGRH